jgi:hypothetical protein
LLICGGKVPFFFVVFEGAFLNGVFVKTFVFWMVFCGEFVVNCWWNVVFCVVIFEC